MLKASDPCETMRRKVWAIAYNLKWIYPGDREEQRMNAAKLDAFFRARGVVKKPLRGMSKKELARTITQMDEIKRKGIIHDLKSILEQAGIENDITYNREGI